MTNMFCEGLSQVLKCRKSHILQVSKRIPYLLTELRWPVFVWKESHCRKRQMTDVAHLRNILRLLYIGAVTVMYIGAPESKHIITLETVVRLLDAHRDFVHHKIVSKEVPNLAQRKLPLGRGFSQKRQRLLLLTASYLRQGKCCRHSEVCLTFRARSDTLVF